MQGIQVQSLIQEDLMCPGAGIEPVSLALQGRFLTTGPPSKSHYPCFMDEETEVQRAEIWTQDVWLQPVLLATPLFCLLGSPSHCCIYLLSLTLPICFSYCGVINHSRLTSLKQLVTISWKLGSETQAGLNWAVVYAPLHVGWCHSLSRVQFSCSVMSDSLWSHGLQHTRSPCPSLSPRAYSNSCALSRWCHPTISSSVVAFSSHV